MAEAARRIVITGVSRGLGRALAEWLASAGHAVHGCARQAAALRELSASWGEPHSFAAVDVADDAAVAAWARDVHARLGGPCDLLINNAALMNRPAPLWEQGAAEFDALIEVNVSGVANVIRHFAPPMVAAGRGVIVNLSSGWGRSVSANVAPYCGSKWAIEGLTRALAEELPQGMAAIPLNPGVIDTDMLRSAWGDDAEQYKKPDQWVRRAGPRILSFSAQDNGQSLTV